MDTLKELMHYWHVIVSFLLLCAGLLFAFYRHWKGRTGADDLAFMVLRLYPEHGGMRRIRGCSADTTTLKIVVDNLWLRIRIDWAFWKSKTAALIIPDAKLRRKILSEFRHHFSSIMNGQTAGAWANRDDDEPDTIEFSFSVSDEESSHHKKMRAIALRTSDLEWIRANGVGQILFSHEGQYDAARPARVPAGAAGIRRVCCVVVKETTL